VRFLNFIFLFFAQTGLAVAYGSIAYSPGDGRGFIAVNERDQASADQKALGQCQSAGLLNCMIGQRFAFSCVGSHLDKMTRREYYASGSSQWEAMNKAADKCRRQYRGAYSNCYPNRKACDTGYVPPPPPPAPKAPEPPGLMAGPYFLLALCLAAGILYVYFKLPAPRPPKEVLPPPRDPSEVPSAEETKRALNHLRLARTYYDEAINSKDDAERSAKLYRASRSIVLARSLAPNISMDVETKDGPIRETLDQLAARCLFYESVEKYYTAKVAEEGSLRWLDKPDRRFANCKEADRFYEKMRRENAAEALPAAEKAVAYVPTNIKYLCHLVRAYRMAGQPAKAQEALARAQRLAPDDIEVLKLADE